MIGESAYSYTAKELNSVLACASVRPLKLRAVRIDSTRSIPNVCGYSADRSTIYIDRDLPLWHFIDSDVDCKRFAILHAHIEMSVRDAIASGDESLLIHARMTDAADDPLGHAHAIATTAEVFAVESQYMETGARHYRKFMTELCARPVTKPLPDDFDPALAGVPNG